jgi:hypothetical protein
MVRDTVRTLSRVEVVKVACAADAVATFVQDVSVDRCHSNVTVAKEFLHGADLVIKKAGPKTGLVFYVNLN